MFNFKSAEDVMSLSEFRNNLSSCVEKARKTGRPLLLTQNGRTAGVFLTAAGWDALQEKLYNGEVYEDLLVSEGEIDRGETYTTDEVMKMVDAEIAKVAKSKKAKRLRGGNKKKVAA